MTMKIKLPTTTETPLYSKPDDPVHEEDDGWWFYDETWADRYGPYENEETARDALTHYCKEQLGE